MRSNVEDRFINTPQANTIMHRIFSIHGLMVRSLIKRKAKSIASILCSGRIKIRLIHIENKIKKSVLCFNIPDFESGKIIENGQSKQCITVRKNNSFRV